MDQRERYTDPAEGLRLALASMQSRLWTALPCVVKNFPAQSGISQMMLDAQPVIAGTVLNAQGTFDTIQMPLLVDIPILWQGGGGVTLTFPIQPGDECLVIFASRCIDAWWQQGVGSGNAPGVVPPDQRMHNLSDGFALVGVRSLPREYAVNSTAAVLQSDDGQAFISIDSAAPHAVNVTTPGTINALSTNGSANVNTPNGIVHMNGVIIDSNGNLTVPGNITCSKTVTGNTDVVGGGKSLKTHVHTGVQTGGGVSGPPQ